MVNRQHRSSAREGSVPGPTSQYLHPLPWQYPLFKIAHPDRPLGGQQKGPNRGKRRHLNEIETPARDRYGSWLLRCMGPFVARLGSADMSAVRSLSGDKRTKPRCAFWVGILIHLS
jgi:hypothetical protein